MPQMWSSPSISTWPLLRSVLLAIRSNSGHGAQPVVEVLARLVDREVVLLVVGVDEPLHRALAERAVADDRRRHEVEAHRLAEVVGGQLAAVQPRLEVPQRTLAAGRLVDRLGDVVVAADVDQERRVAAPGHPPFDLDLAAGEQRPLRRPVAAVDHVSSSAGRCARRDPSGSPQNTHAGRPAPTTELAWSQKPASLAAGEEHAQVAAVLERRRGRARPPRRWARPPRAARGPGRWAGRSRGRPGRARTPPRPDRTAPSPPGIGRSDDGRQVVEHLAPGSRRWPTPAASRTSR